MIGRMITGLVAVVTALALGVGGTAASASSTGPTLSPSASALAASLACGGDPASGPTPVLLVPGTTLTASINFDWNYEPAFTRAGRAWCAVTVPDHGMADIQTAAEYIVNGIRMLHARAGRRIDVVGYSQGGMSPRWALKWWPDTRAMVDDLVSIDGSNHGTLDANALCLLTCAPSIWQQQQHSHLLDTLNAGGETFAGISYSQVWSDTDEIVVPNLGPAASTALSTGAGRISNTAVQSICPLDVSEHIAMGTVDPVAYALVLDALDHDGPASAARISRAVCLQGLLPGVSAASAAYHLAIVGATAGEQVVTYPHTASEPAPAPYAR
ncbi:MAG: esterase/lipase family protein [Jatrophihabitans sp.]|uniref:esterase/lipase family protein n=1 Tax=Jatrophihabitans sp. TaxID=1932789 RepID=UPI003F80B08C